MFEVQKACSAILVILDGITSFPKANEPTHLELSFHIPSVPANTTQASGPKFVARQKFWFEESTNICVKWAPKQKARSPIFDKLDGITKSPVRFEQLEKALSPIEVKLVALDYTRWNNQISC